MKWELKENFRRGRVLGSCLGSPLRKVKVLNLQTIHLVQVQNLLAHPKHFDLHNHPDLVHHHLVLLPKVELHLKDALVVVSLTLGLVVLLKCVFSVDK